MYAKILKGSYGNPCKKCGKVHTDACSAEMEHVGKEGELVEKANPYHGPDGRFTSKPSSGGKPKSKAQVARERDAALTDAEGKYLDTHRDERDAYYKHGNGSPQHNKAVAAHAAANKHLLSLNPSTKRHNQILTASHRISTDANNKATNFAPGYYHPRYGEKGRGEADLARGLTKDQMKALDIKPPKKSKKVDSGWKQSLGF